MAKRRPMKVISTPDAAVRYGPSMTSCTIGNATKPTRAATANDRRIANVDEQQPDRDEERHRGEHRGATGEGEDAAPAPEPGEDRVRVADHGCATTHVGESPHTGVGQRGPDQRRGHTLGAVADEHGDRRPTTERFACVPEPGVAVADLAEVDLRSTGSHQIGDGDRPDQVTEHDGDGDRDCRFTTHR